MWHRQVTNGATDNAIIRTWKDGDRPRFRVDIVCDSRSFRKPLAEYGTRDEADGMADWFGKTGNLRAEVTSIGAS